MVHGRKNRKLQDLFSPHTASQFIAYITCTCRKITRQLRCSRQRQKKLTVFTQRHSIGSQNNRCENLKSCKKQGAWRSSKSVMCHNLLYLKILCYIFRHVRNTTKKTVSFLMSVCPSVRTQGTNSLPLDGFSRIFIFSVFFENLSRKI